MSDIKIRIDQPHETVWSMTGEYLVIPQRHNYTIHFNYPAFGDQDYELRELIASLPNFNTEAIKNFTAELITAVRRSGDDWVLTDWQGVTSFLSIVEQYLMPELSTRQEYICYMSELNEYVTKI